MSENTSYPVYTLITNNLQLVLIIMLIRSIFKTKVLQGSVATSLRCDGIFNDQFITNHYWVRRWKKLKIGQHLPKLWAIK